MFICNCYRQRTLPYTDICPIHIYCLMKVCYRGCLSWLCLSFAGKSVSDIASECLRVISPLKFLRGKVDYIWLIFHWHQDYKVKNTCNTDLLPYIQLNMFLQSIMLKGVVENIVHVWYWYYILKTMHGIVILLGD